MEEGSKRREYYSAFAPIVTVQCQGYVLSFTWCESMQAAVASTPFCPELQPALFSIGERANFATGSTFQEPASMSCTIHLVTINGLIHKASWL